MPYSCRAAGKDSRSWSVQTWFARPAAIRVGCAGATRRGGHTGARPTVQCMDQRAHRPRPSAGHTSATSPWPDTRQKYVQIGRAVGDRPERVVLVPAKQARLALLSVSARRPSDSHGASVLSALAPPMTWPLVMTMGETARREGYSVRILQDLPIASRPATRPAAAMATFTTCCARWPRGFWWRIRVHCEWEQPHTLTWRSASRPA